MIFVVSYWCLWFGMGYCYGLVIGLVVLLAK